MTAHAVGSVRFEKIAVIGAGTMGRGIVQLFAQNNIKVSLYDASWDQSNDAFEEIGATLEKLARKGKLEEGENKIILKNIQLARKLEDLNDCQMVVEAVIEDITIKQNIFKKLEEICSENCVFASNTSTLSITALASVLTDPGRLVGMHFFNPAPVMKLVEVIRGLVTGDEHVESVKNLAESLGKKVVVCTSTPGFIVNRISRPFYGESLEVKQTSNLDVSVIDGLIKASGQFRMGAFELIDLIGVEVNYRNTESIFKEFYYDKRYKPSLIQKEYVDAEYYGRKTGRGFYNYPSQEQTPFQVMLAESQAVSTNTEGEKKIENFEIGYYQQDGDRLFLELMNRVEEAGISASKINEPLQVDPQISYLKVNGVNCVIAEDICSSEFYELEGEKVVVLDLANDYNAVEVLGFSVDENIPKNNLQDLKNFFLSLGIQLIAVPDTPGQIVLRTVVMLINEACDAVHQGVCSEEDADNGVVYGLNYSRGLFEWAEKLGWNRVKRVLEALYDFYQLERYRTSPLIQLKCKRRYK